jgi:gephyrin
VLFEVIENYAYVVSDTASASPTADKSGPTIKEILKSRGITCDHALIVPDEVLEIQGAVKRWCNQGDIDWIITSGGTGFGLRDLTPEVIHSYLLC